MKIWYRWNGRYSAEHEMDDDSRSSGDAFVIDAMGDEKGAWGTKSMLDEKKTP